MIVVVAAGSDADEVVVLANSEANDGFVVAVPPMLLPWKLPNFFAGC